MYMYMHTSFTCAISLFILTNAVVRQWGKKMDEHLRSNTQKMMRMKDYCSTLCLPLTAACDVINLGRDVADSMLFLSIEQTSPIHNQ